ncbi:MAG: hypothetical protein IBJ16_00445 [Chitinophagaceae bacterium]|nr:hypothetical protein [Chitinophagaceae bacterium]
MRLTHPAYIKLVFRTYQLLRSTPEFSPALKQPTPASIRKECLTVYKERPHRKDEPVLRSFFGPAASNNSFLTAIEKFPTDGFRAFVNYLKGKAVKTDDKNVELLAWLIDFPHRPYRYGMDIMLSEKENAILNGVDHIDENVSQEIEEVNDDDEAILDQPHENALENHTEPTVHKQIPIDYINPVGEIKSGKNVLIIDKKWLIIGVALFVSILSVGIYWRYDKSANCMYWTGDHYEKIDCAEDINDKVVFNEDRWKNFRKITDLSTITEKSIGVVHYFGNKNREFFTSGGKHPIETTRYLRVMTRYIWEKEFGSKDSLKRGSYINNNKNFQITNTKK